ISVLLAEEMGLGEARSSELYLGGLLHDIGKVGVPDAIPLSARIMAVADACDAMMSDRPYRAGMPPEEIESVLRRGAGKQWAPDVVQAWLVRKDEILAVQARGLGASVLQAIGNAVDGRYAAGGRAAWSQFVPVTG